MYFKILSLLFLFLPSIALADQTFNLEQTGFANLLRELGAFIFGPLLVFLLAIAFIAFAWGVFKYFIADAEGDKAAAKSLMIWGIGGFVLILILFGVVNLLVDFTNLGDGELKNLPTAPTKQ